MLLPISPWRITFYIIVQWCKSSVCRLLCVKIKMKCKFTSFVWVIVSIDQINMLKKTNHFIFIGVHLKLNQSIEKQNHTHLITIQCWICFCVIWCFALENQYDNTEMIKLCQLLYLQMHDVHCNSVTNE